MCLWLSGTRVGISMGPRGDTEQDGDGAGASLWERSRGEHEGEGQNDGQGQKVRTYVCSGPTSNHLERVVPVVRQGGGI